MPPRVPLLLLAVAAGAALLLVALLAVQNAGLRAELDDLSYRSSRPQAGEYVPSFLAATLDGDSLRVVTGDPARRQVLVVFTTTCPYCEASIPAWNRLSDHLAAEGTALIGISLDPEEETRTYRQRHGLRYPVIRFPQESVRQMYRGGWVPATMVVDGEGLILHARMGEMTIGPATDSVIAAVRWAPVPAYPAAGEMGAASRAGTPPARATLQPRRQR